MSRWLRAAGIVADEITPPVKTPKTVTTLSNDPIDEVSGVLKVLTRGSLREAGKDEGGFGGFEGFEGFDDTPFDDAVDPVVEIFEERAATLEFDGGLSRLEAEGFASRDAGFADLDAYHAFLKRHRRFIR